ncbi:MAG TPA: helix-turn-helix transcriptional regulator [Candidatus Stercorousia faecigallinarum]|nr:helix-turn-helix transcriptional regulator [Candidatus Stercorousia faecigallinarum]
MANITKKFGKRLKEIRKMRNLAQSQLAELSGLETATISRIENGVQYPRPENLDKFSEILNVDVKKFFNYGHYNTKKDLIRDLNNIFKTSTLKAIQYFKKVICSYMKSKQ